MEIACNNCHKVVMYQDRDGKQFIRNVAWINPDGRGMTKCKKCGEVVAIPIMAADHDGRKKVRPAIEISSGRARVSRIIIEMTQ
jgi:hypothetical protein